MEWLKKLLESAKITDGALEVNALLQSIQKELPQHMMPKDEYNAKAKELEAASATIRQLKKDNQDNESLQAAIKAHEETISTLQREKEDIEKTYAVREALKEKGCTDPEYLIFKKGGVDSFAFDGSRPVGIEDVIAEYKDNKVLFPTGSKEQPYNPTGGNGGTPSKNPFAKETFNLTEQGKLLKEDPAAAKAMASEAGVEI